MADWAARSSAHRYGKIKCDAGHEEELRRAATATARTARLRLSRAGPTLPAWQETCSPSPAAAARRVGVDPYVASSNVLKYFYRFFLSCTSLGAPMPFGERSSIAHLRLAPFRPIEVLSIEKAMCQKPTRERGTQHVIRCQRLHLHSVLLSIT